MGQVIQGNFGAKRTVQRFVVTEWAEVKARHNDLQTLTIIFTTHIVGVVNGHKMTVTSPLVTPVGQTVTTESGTVYELSGPSRFTDDALAAWTRYKELNNLM